MENKKILLQITDLTKYFPVKKTRLFQRERFFVKAVDGVTLSIYEGETLGLVGESGCGKSTLGRVLLQLYPQTGGAVRYYGRARQEPLPSVDATGERAKEAPCSDGIDLTKLSPGELRVLRRDMQMIFQDPYSSLNPRMTAGQMIGDGLAAHALYPKNSAALREVIRQVMGECGLAPYMQNRYPHQLSGGERQRVGIARALALRPKFIVCDEAVSALDVSVQSQILNLLRDLKQRNNLTYLFISHNLSVVKYISDRIGVMYLGRIVELATTSELFATPRHPYTRALLAAIPTMDAGGAVALLEGDVPSPVNPPSGCAFHTRCRYATAICAAQTPVWEEAAPGHFVACHNKAQLAENERPGC